MFVNVDCIDMLENLYCDTAIRPIEKEPVVGLGMAQSQVPRQITTQNKEVGTVMSFLITLSYVSWKVAGEAHEYCGRRGKQAFYLCSL